MAYVVIPRDDRDFTCPGVSVREQKVTGTIGIVVVIGLECRGHHVPGLSQLVQGGSYSPITGVHLQDIRGIGVHGLQLA